VACSKVEQLEHGWAEGEWPGHHSNHHRLALVGVVVRWPHEEQEMLEQVDVEVDEGGAVELTN